MVGQQICKWALLMEIWTGKFFWSREECLAGFPAEDCLQPTGAYEFMGLLQANYLIFPSPPCLLKINAGAKIDQGDAWPYLPQLASSVQTSVHRCPMEWNCPQPKEDHFSGVIGGPVAGPAGREPTSALGTPLWCTSTFRQSGIYFLLESLKTSPWIYNIFSLNT